MPTYSFRLSCLVTMVTILLGSHISFTSARSTDKSTRLQTSRITKRDAYMGLEMHCKLHPRNCVGGYMEKKNDPRFTQFNTKIEDPTFAKLRRVYLANQAFAGALKKMYSLMSKQDDAADSYPPTSSEDTQIQDIVDSINDIKRKFHTG